MQKKLKLKQADEYDYRVATQYAVKAVLGYMTGETYCDRIGNEQGDIPEWDDVVLHRTQGPTIHCQVKRQMAHFCNNQPVRAYKARGEKTQLQELSALDSAFKQLSTYFAMPESNRGEEKRFRLSIPYPSIQIKNGLTIVHLKDVCCDCNKVGATVSAFSATQGHAAHVRDWLKSWCDFASDEAIFDCLKSLEIVDHGDEARVDSDCCDLLANWYEPADKVRCEIRDFIVNNASSDQSITPRMIAKHIDSYMRPDQRAWARYHKADALNWDISGTLSGHGNKVEPAESVVDRLWTPVPGRSYELQFTHKCAIESSDALQHSLLRLALHVAHGVRVVAAGVEGWRATVAQTVRKSLGTSDGDLSALGWADWQASSQMPADRRQLCMLSHIGEESSQMEASMSSLMWRQIKVEVNNAIINSLPGEIRDAVEALWAAWKDEIDADPVLQQELAANMLHAKSEGDQALGALRAGPKTVLLVRDALMVLLHLAVGCDSKDHSWEAFVKDKRTVAMLFWAGPYLQPGRVRRFFDQDRSAERSEFLGKETTRLLVLPQSVLSPSEVYSKSLAAGSEDGDGLADSRTPTVIVTCSVAYQEAIEQNTLAGLRAFFQGALQERETQRTKHINALTTG